jgi:hypothetical protein
MSPASLPKPLDGVRVLDLASVFAGPLGEWLGTRPDGIEALSVDEWVEAGES